MDKTQAPAADQAIESDKKIEKVETDFRQSARIVILDDSDYNRKATAKILQAAGLNVIGETGVLNEAAQILSINNGNIILIDLIMPQLSGIEVIKDLKEHFSQLKMILLSPLLEEHIIREAFAAGAADVLPVPLDARQLINCVSKMAAIIHEEES